MCLRSLWDPQGIGRGWTVNLRHPKALSPLPSCTLPLKSLKAHQSASIFSSFQPVALDPEACALGIQATALPWSYLMCLLGILDWPSDIGIWDCPQPSLSLSKLIFIPWLYCHLWADSFMFISSSALSGASEPYFPTAFVSFCHIAYLVFISHSGREIVNSMKAGTVFYSPWLYPEWIVTTLAIIRRRMGILGFF